MKNKPLYIFTVFFCLSIIANQVWSQSEPAVVDTTASAPATTQEPATESTSKSIKSIEVVGNKTISLATILSKIKSRVGQDYIQTVISDDLKRLYNTGYFADVRVDRQDYEGGLKVIIYLEEKPIIEEVTFSKTRFINSRVIKQKIETKVGKFLDNKVLKDDIQTIKDLYSKKGLTNAEVDVQNFVDETTNKVTLHFVIREGYVVKIKHINVLGNAAFKDARIIKVIKTRAKNLFNSGYLKEDILQEDMERITSFYEQQGYIDAKVDYVVEQLYKGLIDVNINVSEGKRYYVGSLAISGNKIISEKEIIKAMTEIKDGGIFSREKLGVDISNIRTLYFDRGYIFANVSESTSLDPNSGKVDAKIDIEEGNLAYIEKVKIQGNTRTRDIVIRREVKMYPGDQFDGAKLRRSKERLNNLGYFEDVNFDIEDTDANDRKNLLVQVKEAKTGTFSFGGGYSTVDQLVGFVEVEQRNFDFTNWPTFTGGGQYLSLRAETGSTRRNAQISFTEPWIFDYPVSGGFDAYINTHNRERDVGYAYDEKRIGGDIRFGKRFSDIDSGNVVYKIESVKISNLEENVSTDLLAESGTNLISSTGVSWTRDTTDSTINPTKGLYLNGGLDAAGGVLGGDKDFERAQIRGSYYVPLKFKSVLELRSRVGIVNSYGESETVPIFERFFAGGARSIRGYNERKVGPLDANTNDPVGGESLIVSNIEYTIPVIDFIKVAAFFDTGGVWSKVRDIASGDYKSGMGVGVRVKTPVGPVNLDYGYPLNDEPGEESRSGKFYFSVSRGF